jgi:lysine 6-dehydrogenase
MPNTYAILGAGMQGTAAAYDLARFAPEASIRLGDVSLNQARSSADRVNQLVGRDVCEAHTVDALDSDSLSNFLGPVDVVLSCVPYWMHPRIAPVAIRTHTHMCDLGGNTDVTWKTLQLNDQAASSGVTLVPDCGLAPGTASGCG